MKKIIFCIMATILSLTFLPVQAFAATTDKPSSPVATKPVENAESVEAKTLILRLDEIKAMDMSKLKSTEKKDLRKEVRSIKRELKTISGGVYISAGLLIVILIILIVLV
jgi:hypothetical protein